MPPVQIACVVNGFAIRLDQKCDTLIIGPEGLDGNAVKIVRPMRLGAENSAFKARFCPHIKGKHIADIGELCPGKNPSVIMILMRMCGDFCGNGFGGKACAGEKIAVDKANKIK